MKKFYTASEVKIATTNAATTAATQATLEGSKKAVAFGGIGMLLGTAITLVGSNAYCKKIKNECVKSNQELKKDIRVLRAGVVEADQALTSMGADYNKLPAVREAARLIIERSDPEAFKKLLLEEQKAKEEKQKKDENKKKGGDK